MQEEKMPSLSDILKGQEALNDFRMTVRPWYQLNQPLPRPPLLHSHCTGPPKENVSQRLYLNAK